MAGSGSQGSGATRSVRGVEALRDVKRVEEEVREKKVQAREQAQTIIADARDEARSILEEAREEADKEAERIVLEAREEAQEEAEILVEEAQDRAGKLRDVSDTRLDKAADAVLDRFKQEIGGV